MEDVVVHYRAGSTDGPGSLAKWAEHLLQPFPCRSPPLFKPWFTNNRSAIRPARAPPVITGDWQGAQGTNLPKHCSPASAEKRRSSAGSSSSCSWSVFSRSPEKQRPLSGEFQRAVNACGLDLRQRAKWVITRRNFPDIEKVWRCLIRFTRNGGGAVAALPSCNANIQRERAEIWVFCDVMHAEQVGRALKEGLQLSGRIRLTVHGRGEVFSL